MWKIVCLGLLLTLGGCIVRTPYQPMGYSGGYSEEMLEPDVYRVSFQGNGNTGGDQVWYYWIYRCAELTKQKGYNYFYVVKDDGRKPADKNSSISHPGNFYYASWQPDQDGLLPVHHGGGGGGSHYYTTTTYTTVTRWHSIGIVNMSRSTFMAGSEQLLAAQKVLDDLGPYVTAQGTAPTPPPRDTVLRDATVPKSAHFDFFKPI